MAFQVVVTQIANEDLGAIVRYIAQDDPAAAERFGMALIAQLELLPGNPFLGRVVPERHEPNLRELIHGAYYRIIYRVQEERCVIEALRFWHAARGTPTIGS